MAQGIESATKNMKILQEPTTQFEIHEMKDATSTLLFSVVGKMVIIQISAISNLSHVITVASWGHVKFACMSCEKASETSGTTFRLSTPHQPSFPRSSITSNIKSAVEYEYTLLRLGHLYQQGSW